MPASTQPHPSDLLPQVYRELRDLARWRLKRLPPGQTIQPTALVHEAYLRIRDNPAFDDRAHFFRVAARAMRDIVVERARRAASTKRAGQWRRIDFGDELGASTNTHREIIAVDGALKRLEQADARAAEVVTLRFFAGLTSEEAAAALGVTTRTVERDWRYARAWLHRALLAETEA